MPLFRVSPSADGKGGLLVYILDDAVWAATEVLEVLQRITWLSLWMPWFYVLALETVQVEPALPLFEIDGRLSGC